MKFCVALVTKNPTLLSLSRKAFPLFFFYDQRKYDAEFGGKYNEDWSKSPQKDRRGVLLFSKKFHGDRWDCSCCFEDITHAVTVIHCDQDKPTAAK